MRPGKGGNRWASGTGWSKRAAPWRWRSLGREGRRVSPRESTFPPTHTHTPPFRAKQGLLTCPDHQGPYRLSGVVPCLDDGGAAEERVPLVFVWVVNRIPEGPAFLGWDGQGRLGDGDAFPWRGRKVRCQEGRASRLPHSRQPLPTCQHALVDNGRPTQQHRVARHGESLGRHQKDVPRHQLRGEYGFHFCKEETPDSGVRWGLPHWSTKGGSGLRGFGPPVAARGVIPTRVQRGPTSTLS